MKTLQLIGFSLGLWGSLAQGNEPSQSTFEAVETGKVRWGRDLEAGLAESRSSGKPVFLLFQEVPGCSGCQQFGREVLADERMVREIEGNFVPVFIYNNRGGKDGEILKRYGESAWNFQVIRFLDGQGRDLIPRKDGIWTLPAVAGRMVESLQKAGRPVEAGLLLLAGRAKAATEVRERVAFAQACFWTGEMRLGQIEGVLKTEAGFFDGHEVTLVEYDSARIGFPELIGQALERQCADQIYVTTAEQRAIAEKNGGGRKVGILDGRYRTAPSSDQKKQIQGTRAEGRALTPEQATKVNAYIRSDPAKAERFLNPIR